jgi:flotillin
MPHDIRNKSFQRVLRGYAPDEVDEYIAYLQDEYRKLERRTADSERKLALALKKLDESIRNGAVDTVGPAAREAASKLLKEAEAEAEKIRRRAKGEADAILLRMQAEADGMKEILMKQAEGFRELVQSAGGEANDAIRLMIADKLEEITRIQVEAIKNLQIDKITVWDSGAKSDGGKGTTADFISGLYKSVPPLTELFDMAGMQLPAYLGTPKADAIDAPSDGN